MIIKRSFSVALWLLLSTVHASAKSENRCGWFDNPSSSNATISDRDGVWDIAEQGGLQAKGDWPRFNLDDESSFVQTGHGSYGYGCVCLEVESEKKKKRIVRIIKATTKKLSVCRGDKKLKEPVNPLNEGD